MSHSESKLFQPIKVGIMTLQHRVVMAPLTRYKVDPATNVPVLPLVKECYSQRASNPGTLIIAEAALISPEAGGRAHMPGIWSAEQIAAWKEIVAAVHAHGSFMYLQLRAMGRAADVPDLTAKGFAFVAPSAIPIAGKPTPRAMTVPEIHSYIAWFATAARNAVTLAGFDGVELHFAYGYLGDQFIQDVSNQRTDVYGGSAAARSRFPLEVIDAVTSAVGAERTAVRFSPWSDILGMGMSDPLTQFTHIVQALKDRHPDLAYLHLVEPENAGARNMNTVRSEVRESNDALREIWAPRPLIVAGGFTRESALQYAEKGDLIAFGRLFISNPDLPLRLKHGIPLTAPDVKTFYIPAGSQDVEIGYTDYPFAEELKS